jgi:hypothetical protein
MVLITLALRFGCARTATPVHMIGPEPTTFTDASLDGADADAPPTGTATSAQSAERTRANLMFTA